MDNPNFTKNEEELNELKKKYEFLIHTIPDVIWTKDFEGNITFISPNVEKIFGYSQAEFYKGDSEQIWYERIHPNDVENVRQAYDKLFHKNLPFNIEYQYKRKDGDIIWLRDVSTNVYERAGVFYADGLTSDISLFKLTELKLKETEFKYKELIENIPDVAWTKDQDGNTAFISPNVEKIYGYSPEEIYSREGEDIWFGRIDPDSVENIMEAYKAFFKQRSPFDVEYRIKRKDGTWIWI
ncbi:MAG: PAS domain-containing protein, partial [Candidatus Hermodarchaeota archaeon]